MSDTYSKIYIQIIFSTQNRLPVISQSWEDELFKYITGIITKKNQKLIEINGTRDHIHFLIGMKPSCCLSDLVREIKKSSNKFIKEKGFIRSNFRWQEGFGAFSYGHSQLDNIIGYIKKQKEHHKNETFEKEYVRFLKRYIIDYDDRYLFP